MELKLTDSRIRPSHLPLLWRLVILAALLLVRCYGQDIDCSQRPKFEDCVATMTSHIYDQLEIENACSELKEVATDATETLECQVQKDVEVIFHGWYFYPSDSSERRMLTIDGDRYTTDTDRLTIKAVREEDEGVYLCNASEDSGPPSMVKAGCLIVHATVPSYTDTKIELSASMDNNVTLPTQVMFENSGYCGVTPVYTQARLRHEGTGNVTFQCDNQFCVLNNTRVYYNFTSLGDVTLRQPVEGSYLMALIQDCPSGTVLRMTYDVTFTNNDNSGTKTLAPTATATGGSSHSTTVTPTVAGNQSARDMNEVIAIVLPVVLIILIGISVSVLFLYIFHKRRPHTFAQICHFHKEPVYEEPNGMVSGDGLVGRVSVSYLQREESIISSQFAPSSIGEKNGVGPYEIDVHLNEKPTDELGSI